MGDELGGLTTSLGLFASPPLLLSTESVVVIEWKGMRASTTASTGRGAPLALQDRRAHALPHHGHD